VITRFSTRAFLICFVSFAVLLGGSFWTIQRFVHAAVRDGLRGSLRENQQAIAKIHAKGDLQNSRFLKIAGENAALKAGMQLLLSNRGNDAARRTVEDQLRELGEHMGFDFLLVSGPNGSPLAAVVRQAAAGSSSATELVPLNPAALDRIPAGLLNFEGRTFQVASIALDQEDENLGSLSVGEYFDLSEFTTAAVLMRNGKVIQSNLSGIALQSLDDALASCGRVSECDLQLRGDHWVSLPMQSWGNGYLLRTLENVDRALVPVQTRLRRLFLTLGIVSALIALLCSLGSSRSIVQPLAAVVSHLRQAVATGVLVEFRAPPSTIVEIRELIEIYNHAATSVRTAGESLETAYLEFVGSLASALDARDQYTSGHSWRVCHLSCALAAALGLPAEDVARIRIGALLHDIGKIGIADRVLQKPGRLTDEEWAVVREHPVIGRRILEGVHGFAPYLSAVELHHENWDGSGYPKGQSGEETPIDARIIHVADAYDAMTTDRSYRRALTHERAISILRENTGRQFDPRIVESLLTLFEDGAALPALGFSGHPAPLTDLAGVV
jgi:HD-GYP domain-containing protein (c-di-GMP phosphodiesterase class II)